MDTQTPSRDDRRLNPVVENRIREEPLLSGSLRIHDSFVNGQLIASVFTLDSLAWCMGMSMSTMEGRYKRARLSQWMVPVPGMAGRPQRGFPYQLLDRVIFAIDHPRAIITGDINGSRVETPAARQIGELVPEMFLGARYYTVSALARSFGVSETTVRNKLARAGLLRRFQNLAPPVHGGRPKRGIHEKHMAEVKLALDHNARYFTKYDMAVYRATGALQQARQDVRAAVVPHIPPAPGSMQAWDRDTLAPVHKNPVDAARVDPEVADQVSELMAEIDALRAEYDAKHADQAQVAQVAQPLAASAPQQVERSGADAPVASMPTDAQARRMEAEQQAATRRSLIEPHLKLLIEDADEPTDADLDDTCYTLDLAGEDATAFKRAVRDGRAARKGAA